MAINIGGIEYENQVKKTIRKVEKIIPDFYLMRGASGAFDRNAPDLRLNINKKPVPVEIKKSKTAQMGGAAYYKFDARKKTFYFVSDDGDETVDIPTQEMISDILKTRVNQVEDFIEFIRNYPPTEYHKKIMGIRISCTKEAWDAARDKGLLKALNTNIKHNVDFIANHYAKKGTNYIQIGGAGLFYLKSNPLKLPIPKLSGNIAIELRLAHHGARKIKSMDISVVDGDLRTQARLLTKNVSPYSLDRPEDITELFSKKT